MLTLTRVVHSCALLDFGGARILTDPWFSERRFYRHGEPRAVPTAADLPELAGVVISHEHYDHCDLDALAAYPDKSVPFAVAAGIGARVRAAGFPNVVELDRPPRPLPRRRGRPRAGHPGGDPAHRAAVPDTRLTAENRMRPPGSVAYRRE